MSPASAVDRWLAAHEAELVALRRDLHMHPELGWTEHRTTKVLVERLEAAGLAPEVLAGGTGLVCDVGEGDGPLVGLRADIDALPLQDVKDVPYRSRTPGTCHACGHDVHTAVVLGAGLALATLRLPGRVRLFFQPAEELMPGGAIDVVRQGWADELSVVYGLHCDPSLEVGRVGVKSGPITAAADSVRVRLSGPDVDLPARMITPIGLLIHELATNAVKHGALSTPNGRVAVICREGLSGEIELTWVESGGPPIAEPPTRRGFGTRLLERALARDLGTGAAVELHFEPEGLRASIRFAPRAAGKSS